MYRLSVGSRAERGDVSGGVASQNAFLRRVVEFTCDTGQKSLLPYDCTVIGLKRRVLAN